MNKSLLAVMAGLALAGCETSPAKSEAPQAASKTAAVSAAGDHRATDSHEETAPLLLSLQAVADENGVLELQAHLDAQASIAYPVELTVALPPGATLVSGDARQSVPVAAGRTTRSFRVAHGAALTPIKVVAHVVHPDKAWGIHAEKFYPEVAKPSAYVPPPAPPMARPPRPGTLPASHPKEAH